MSESSYSPCSPSSRRDRFVAADDALEDPSRTNVDDRFKDLVGMISPCRAEQHDEWIRIGLMLHSLYDGSQQGLQHWLMFSQQYDSDAALTAWQGFEKSGISIRTLHFYARSDEPELYREWNNTRAYMRTLQGDPNTHTDVATTLSEMFCGVYVCAGIQLRVWYEFKNHVWVKIEEGHTLRRTLANEYKAVLVSAKQYCVDMLGEAQKGLCDINEDSVEKQIKLYDKLLSNVLWTQFRNCVMQESCHMFYDATFLQRLDTNPHLIAFTNGVYDLKTCTLRPGLPDDMLSMQMPVPYREFAQESAEVKAVHRFLEQVLPDPEIRKYFLDMHCDLFVGGNTKTVVLWTGVGDNGKSVTELLFEKMLGTLAIKLPTSLITGKRGQSNSACPELARAGGGVRWAVFQEPDIEDRLNVGVLKELSGRDSFYARKLYSDGAEVTPMFRICLVCNDPPKVPAGDAATWNRIRVIPFEARFVDNPPESCEEQLATKTFQKDARFSDKLGGLAEALAFVLLHHRQQVRGIDCDAIHEPEKVLLATTQYRDRSDIYSLFVSEVLTAEPDAFLPLPAAYAQYKAWFKESEAGVNMPSKSDFKHHVSIHLGTFATVDSAGLKLRQPGWSGWRFQMG